MDQQVPLSEPQESQTSKEVIHSFPTESLVPLFTKQVFFFFIAMGVFGVLTGFTVAALRGGAPSSLEGGIQEKPLFSSKAKSQVFGSPDEKTFKDQTEGVLKEGGIDGEGSHHLERPGGVSQNVYLTSSVVDLSLFKGKRVKVWGETHKAKKAGWLMDVGRLQVVE